MPIVVEILAPDGRVVASVSLPARETFWSDGAFTELKTYGHACSNHLGLVFRESEERRQAYVALPSETVEEIGIFRYEQGKRDRQLQRLWGLEENYRS